MDFRFRGNDTGAEGEEGGMERVPLIHNHKANPLVQALEKMRHPQSLNRSSIAA